MGRGKSEDMAKLQEKSLASRAADWIREKVTPAQVTGQGAARQAAETIRSRGRQIEEEVKKAGG